MLLGLGGDELSSSDWSGCLSGGRLCGWTMSSPETLRETQDELSFRQAGQEELWRGLPFWNTDFRISQMTFNCC